MIQSVKQVSPKKHSDVKHSVKKDTVGTLQPGVIPGRIKPFFNGSALSASFREGRKYILFPAGLARERGRLLSDAGTPSVIALQGAV